MQKQSVGRVAYLDVIRVVATVGVITLHVYAAEYFTPVGSSVWYNAVVGDSLVRWAVPLFVMISGALFLHPMKRIGFTELRQKYLPRLLTVYLFWWVVYSVVRTSIALLQGEALQPGLIGPHFHLWYLPMLMGVYVCIPFLKRIVAEDTLVKVALWIWVVYCIGGFCHADKVPQLGIFFRMNNVVGYAGYFLLGYYVSSHPASRRQSAWIYAIGVMGAVGAIAGNMLLSFHDGESNSMFLNNLGPCVIAMSLAVFVCCQRISPQLEQRLMPLIEYVRPNLFGIYLTHALWLIPLWYEGVRCRVPCHWLVMPVLVVVIFFCSLYTTRLLRRVPWLRKVVE